MTEITLTRAKKVKDAELTFNLTDEETGKVVKYEYTVKRIGGKAAMEFQLMRAELRNAKDRNELVGSAFLREILNGTHPKGKTPDMLELFDLVDDKGLESVVEALINAAKSPTIGE